MPTDLASLPTRLWSWLPQRLGGGRRSIRAKVCWHLAVVAAMLTLSAAATLHTIDRISYYVDRNRLAAQQLETLFLLSAHVNRYSENVAELLLLGRSEIDDFDEARSSFGLGLDDLAELTDRELDLIGSQQERDVEADEAGRVTRLRELYRQIERTVQRLLLLYDEGRQEEAVTLFRDAVEEGYSAELDAEIAAAVGDEESELLALRQRTSQLEARLFWLVLGVSGLALLISAWASLRLARALDRPISEFITATRAVGEGDLGVRLDADQPEEFAALAQHFNRTVAQLEAQRRELLDVQTGLEATVSHRTSELEEANARLSRLDQMRMLFLADISHELRTPLTVLRGEAEVALRGRVDPDAERETLRRVVQISEQLGRLVDDLLFLARAEVGAVRFEMQPVVVQEVLEITLADARILAEARGLKVEASLAEPPLRIQGDPGRLAQAVMAVLDNAAKYAERGSSICVDLHREEGHACLEVSNIGAGVPKADLPFVFHRFWRGRPEGGTAAAEGSGLGLPIAKWIVDTHGGSVALRSEGGVTTVTLRLPLARA
jgi:two-component system, OmpR family, sensor kinase